MQEPHRAAVDLNELSRNQPDLLQLAARTNGLDTLIPTLRYDSPGRRPFLGSISPESPSVLPSDAP